jgi:hypothetical protein
LAPLREALLEDTSRKGAKNAKESPLDSDASPGHNATTPGPCGARPAEFLCLRELAMSAPTPTPSRTDATLQLDEIRQVLAQTLAAAVERYRALAGPPADDAAPDREEALRRLFDQVEARMRAFHECTERAGRDAGEVYTALAEREDALRAWLVSAAKSRQSLADWAARAV